MKKTVQIIRYIRYHPMSSTSEILKAVNISEAGFYRHKKHAKTVLGVEITFSTHGNNQGHEITNYGIIDRFKL